MLVRTYGASSESHCTSLLRKIFTSLARAHEHMHMIHSIEISYAKLDSEINAHFLWNKIVDLYFLLHNFGV